jgi:DNA/RNA-binding domain of Phe-tRNA-synthetase-like protein
MISTSSSSTSTPSENGSGTDPVKANPVLEYGISFDVWSAVPGFRRLALYVSERPSGRKQDRSRLEALLRAEELRAADMRGEYQGLLDAWRSAYVSLKLPVNRESKTALERLVTRVWRQGPGSIPFISHSVCVANTLSIRHAVPVGLFDASTVGQRISLRAAHGTESIHCFGEDQASRLSVGEIALIAEDLESAICSRWNSRGNRLHAVGTATTSAIWDFDFLDRVNSAELLRDAEDLISEAGIRIESAHLFSPSSPLWQVELG